MAKLNEYQILEYAIAREQHAYIFYKALSENMADNEAKDMFEELAQEELEHKAQLELEIIKLGRTVPPTTEMKKIDIRQFGLEEGMHLRMDIEDALNIAIEKEELAFQFYFEHQADMANQDSKKILLALAEEEARHKLRFEHELAKIKDSRNT